MLDVWTEKSGFSFGTITEGAIINQPLPVSYSNNFNDSSSVIFRVISGSLPPGLRIVGDKIVGTAYEVPRITEFTFCIRASYNNQISDRSFKITVDGADQPVFNNDPGLLPIGSNETFFILDSSFVDFQINVTDNDTTVGQELKYFISSGDGTLPPGLTLSDSGKISGLVGTLISNVVSSTGTGTYSDGLFDTTGYDFGSRPDNGYDSFIYDIADYDYFIPTLAPKKLNRNYEFIVSVTDGDTVSKRQFRIYVVGDDYLRADNTITRASNGTFKVDGTYLRAPVWETPSNLGVRRANNYITIVLDCYEIPELGPIFYSLDTNNPDNSPSQIPPGLNFDDQTAELFGILPYQPTVSETYHFTVTAYRLGSDGEVAQAKRTFTIQTLGDINSVMTWTTPSYLGSIDANYISNLKVNAISNIVGATVSYGIVSGSLPPGLELTNDGEIIGKVNQYGNISEPGITTFSDGVYKNQTFDGGSTSVDRQYTFVITAGDQFRYSTISQEFVLDVNTPNDRLYSTISTRAFMNRDKRELFNDFINDNTIFTTESVYRPNDPNFGLQRDLKMTVFAGIETKDAARYVSAMGLNHKKKRFTFGEVKSAKAKIPGTNTVVYEVIYIQMYDPLEKNGVYLNQVLELSKDPNPITVDTSNALWDGKENLSRLNRAEPFSPRPYDIITIDQTDLKISDVNTKLRYPSSISLWRKQIATVGAKERNYLPLWMRSIQDESKQELGFTLAIPLCYCKPNTSADILLNIKFSGFDFKQLDYTVDRYIIDSVTGSGNDKYLVFKDDKVTIS